jgi:hypothetical protein
MASIFFEIFTQISPASTNSHHHSLTLFTNQADEKFDGSLSSATRKMIELDLGIAVLRAGSWVFSIGRC